jgi:hypothetical protein
LLVVAFVHPDKDSCAILLNFIQWLWMDGWVLLDTMILSTAYDDSVAGSCQLIFTVHSNTEEGCKPIKLKSPPLLAPWPIAQHLWAPFNKPKLTVSYSKTIHHLTIMP